jgi:hypothetical protein
VDDSGDRDNGEPHVFIRANGDWSFEGPSYDYPFTCERVPCAAGFYTSTGGCIMCQPGRHQPSGRRSSCIDCPGGQYQGGDGKVSCTTCPGCAHKAGVHSTALVATVSLASLRL